MRNEQQFTENDVVELEDLTLPTDLNDDRMTTIKRTVPIRCNVPAFVCEDCGAAWWATGLDDMANARDRYEGHRKRFAPECGGQS